MKAKLKYAAFYRLKGTSKWNRLHFHIQGSREFINRFYQIWLIAGRAASARFENQVRPIIRRKKKTS